MLKVVDSVHLNKLVSKCIKILKFVFCVLSVEMLSSLYVSLCGALKVSLKLLFKGLGLVRKYCKGIVHPKMKMLCLSAYLQGIQDAGDFVSSVEHKQRFFNSNRCSLSVI